MNYIKLFEDFKKEKDNNYKETEYTFSKSSLSRIDDDDKESDEDDEVISIANWKKY